MALMPDCTIKSLEAFKTYCYPGPTLNRLDFIGLGQYQNTDIFVKAPCSNVLLGIENHCPETLRGERFIQVKTTEWEGMPTNTGCSGKTQNENKFYNGKRVKTWLVWMECVGVLRMKIETGHRSERALNVSPRSLSLHHGGKREVLKFHEQERKYIRDIMKARWHSRPS